MWADNRKALSQHPCRHAVRIGTSLIRLGVGHVVPRALQCRIPYFEGSIRVDLATPTGLSIYRYGPRDPDLELVRSIVKPGDIVVDVGANSGLFTLAMALALGGEGTVYAFEPVKRLYRELNRNVAAQGCRTLVYPFALGESDANRAFVEMPGGGGLSSFAPEDPSIGNEIVVETHRLDNILLPWHRDQVALIKLDVEGSEMGVLQGANDIVACSRPAILTEVEDSHLRRQGSSAKELRQYLSDLGYRKVPGASTPNELHVAV